MRKLYNEFFYIPKHGKIREKVMLTRVAMTVVIMVICLAAMSITAYAYFSHNVTSGSNIIKAASFYTDVTVQITAEDGTAVENSNITPDTSDYKNFVVRGLEVGKWYQFTITKKADRNTAQTGFIIVSANGCPTTYHTQQLGVDKSVPGEYTSAITFKLKITDATEVILESHWGTSSYYSDYQISSVDDERYIILNEEIKMIVNGKDISEGNDDNSDGQDGSETTTDTTTTPTMDTTTGTEPSDTTSTTTESTETSEPTESTTEPTTSTSTEPTVTEPTVTEPVVTEPAATESTNTTESTETQPTEETTGAPTTEANE